MKKLLFFTFSLFCLALRAQQWQWAKTITPNVNYPCTNHLSSAKNGDFYLTNNLDSSVCIIKFDTQSNELWRKYIQGSFKISGIETLPNGVYISGSFNKTIIIDNDTMVSEGMNDALLLRLTSSGSLIWSKQMGGAGEDNGNGICTDKSGNIYLTGVYADTAAFGNQDLICECGSEVFIAKFDTLGNINLLKSGKCLNSNSFSQGLNIDVDTTGNIYCMGYFNYFVFDTTIVCCGGGPYGAYFLAKFNSSGNLQWVKQVTNAVILSMNDIAIDSSENVLLTGYYWWTLGGPALTIKFNPSGQKLWEKSVSDCGWGAHGKSDAIAITGNDSYIIGSMSIGYTCPYRPINMLLVKYDSTGIELIHDTINIGNVFSCDIIRDSNGDFIICGVMQGGLTLGNDSLYAPPSIYKVFIAKFKDVKATVGINSLNINSVIGFKVFPNPTDGKFQFTFDTAKNNSSLKIINVAGQTVIEKINIEGNKCSVDISVCPSGMYFLELNQSGSVSRTKLVKD